MSTPYTPIGVLRTCFTEKFGAPRQSLMIAEATGVLKLKNDPSFASALTHLESFSHLWLIFVFNRHQEMPWHPLVQPPRVENPGKVGVFASRSPHRPNPIGMSVVRLDRIDLNATDGIEIHVSGVDILDGTPVLDIKPYLPYADCVPDANPGWAKAKIERFRVRFSEKSLLGFGTERPANFRTLVEQTLAWDPRPISQRQAMPIDDPRTEGKEFAFRLGGVDIKWRVEKGEILVTELDWPQTQ